MHHSFDFLPTLQFTPSESPWLVHSLLFLNIVPSYNYMQSAIHLYAQDCQIYISSLAPLQTYTLDCLLNLSTWISLVDISNLA